LAQASYAGPALRYSIDVITIPAAAAAITAVAIQPMMHRRPFTVNSRIVPGVFELNTFEEYVREWLPSLRGRRELSGKWLPTLVQVSNPNDSATLRAIRPDEFDQVFGLGVRLRGVTIDMTTDAVTHGIEERLPFLIREKEKRNLVYIRPNVFTPNYSYFVRSW
jgi:hypothetical protein